MNCKTFIIPALMIIATVGCSAKDILNAKTQNDINNAINSNKMVVVDYHEESYCAPCKQMAKILPGIAKNFTEVLFVKANISNEGIGQDIQSVPTFVFYSNGKEVKRFSGSKSEASFINILNDTFKCCNNKSNK